MDLSRHVHADGGSLPTLPNGTVRWRTECGIEMHWGHASAFSGSVFWRVDGDGRTTGEKVRIVGPSSYQHLTCPACRHIVEMPDPMAMVTGPWDAAA